MSWDLAGPWGAFALMSLWGSGSVVCALLLPKQPVDPAVVRPEGRRAKARALLPKASDY